ncbi:MAG: hypothetical protein WCB20_04850, partial [Chthoniobacterales bacterium]
MLRNFTIGTHKAALLQPNILTPDNADKSEKLSTQEAGEKEESGIQESTKETGSVRVSWIPGFQIYLYDCGSFSGNWGPRN